MKKSIQQNQLQAQTEIKYYAGLNLDSYFTAMTTIKMFCCYYEIIGIDSSRNITVSVYREHVQSDSCIYTILT